MSFSQVKNQPEVLRLLKDCLRHRHLAHALLFQGPVSAGQMEVARELAKALFCEAKKDWEACEACANCHQLNQGVHPDFFVLALPKDSRVIKVEGIRDLIARASFKPFFASSKVLVIDQAHGMNEVAQNALLKTLEEPQGHTLFILISSAPEGLLATVRSRVQTFHFLPVAGAKPLEPEAAALKKEVLDYMLQDPQGSAKEPPDLSRLERETLSRILDSLMEDLRELLLLRVGAEEALGLAEDLDAKRKLACRYPPDFLRENIERLGDLKEKIISSLNVRLALVVFWDNLKEA